MNIKPNTLTIAVAATIAVAISGAASAANFVLPTPLNSSAIESVYPDANGVPRPALLMDGIPVAFKYDDFWSYSAKILQSIQTVNPALLPPATFGAYNFSTGTGNIVVNLTSVAGGATNPYGLQDPVDLSGGGNNVTGWVGEWGHVTQSSTVWGMTGQDVTPVVKHTYDDPAALQGTTSTVGELLAALQAMNPVWTVPVLYADYNQTGGGDSLFMSAQVRIIDTKGTADKSDDTVAGFWDLDRNTNAAWDQNDPTYNFGDITFTSAANCTTLWNPLTGVGCAGITTSGLTYTGSHNLGSGHADFMAYAPDMDLTLFNPNFLWVATVNLGCNPNGVNQGLAQLSNSGVGQGCNTNGYEEFGIIGGVGPRPCLDCYTVPEPGVLGLLGLGLLGLGVMRRRKA